MKKLAQTNFWLVTLVLIALVGCDKNELSVFEQTSPMQRFNKVPADVDSARHRVARSLA